MEAWSEILESLRKNKLRTFLTGFSVAWGIFILIVLVSFGTSLKGFVSTMFSNDMENTMYVYPSSTSLPYKGTKPGRAIKFDNKDLSYLVENVEDVDLYSARYFVDGSQVVYGTSKGSFKIRCVHPDHRTIEASAMVEGRYVNQYDIDERRKVAVIGDLVKDKLFEDKEAIGQDVVINNVSFKVVGVFTDDSEDEERRMVYLPISTAQTIFADGEKISAMVITINNPSLEKGEIRERDIKKALGKTAMFDPEDSKAIYVSNRLVRQARFNALLDSIKFFTIFVGILSIISGSIGVMNIMVISVKERTKEIGLRRAIGATPYSVISAVISESVVLTIFFGYLGLLFGAGLLSLISSFAENDSSFANLYVDLPLAILATLILVLVGVFSGLVPAYKASKIRPVEALNSN